MRRPNRTTIVAASALVTIAAIAAVAVIPFGSSPDSGSTDGAAAGSATGRAAETAPGQQPRSSLLDGLDPDAVSKVEQLDEVRAAEGLEKAVSGDDPAAEHVTVAELLDAHGDAEALDAELSAGLAAHLLRVHVPADATIIEAQAGTAAADFLLLRSSGSIDATLRTVAAPFAADAVGHGYRTATTGEFILDIGDGDAIGVLAEADGDHTVLLIQTVAGGERP